MISFPLIRRKLTMEQIEMLLMFILCILLIPYLFLNINNIFKTIILVSGITVLDYIMMSFKYKRNMCPISGTCLALMVIFFMQQDPFILQSITALIALFVGKHLQGGQSKNITHPLILALFIVRLFFPKQLLFFYDNLNMTIISFFLLFPFIFFRPYPASGFFIGMIISWFFGNHNITFFTYLSLTIIFSFLIATDNATITQKKIFGFFSALTFSFLSTFFYFDERLLFLSILLLNIFSFFIDKFIKAPKSKTRILHKVIIPKIIMNQNKAVIISPVVNTVTLPIIYHSKEEVIYQLKSHRVFGMGGNAEPIWKKLETFDNSISTNKTFIINAVECDVGIIHDSMILTEKLLSIIEVLELIKNNFNIQKFVIASSKKINEITPPWIEVKKISRFYPMGEEHILACKITKQHILFSDNLESKGIIVLNIQTIESMFRVLKQNEFIFAKWITALDIKNKTATPIKVPIAMKISDIAHICKLSDLPLYTGKGIMRMHKASDDEVIGTQNTILVASNEVEYRESPICCKCGSCRKFCPVRIAPDLIAEAVDSFNIEKTKDYHAENCIECGICSYLCLAGKNLSLRTSIAKAGLLRIQKQSTIIEHNELI